MVFGMPNLPSFSYRSLPGNPRKWVAAKVSKLRERKANEATQLKPIALAGASRGFSGRSQLCNSFARTQVQRATPPKLNSSSKKPSSDDTLSEGDDDDDDGDNVNEAEAESSSRPGTTRNHRYQENQGNYYRGAVDEGQWKPCEMCSRQFLRSDSKFAAFCSLDCKSAAYLGVGAYEY